MGATAEEQVIDKGGIPRFHLINHFCPRTRGPSCAMPSPSPSFMMPVDICLTETNDALWELGAALSGDNKSLHLLRSLMPRDLKRKLDALQLTPGLKLSWRCSSVQLQSEGHNGSDLLVLSVKPSFPSYTVSLLLDQPQVYALAFSPSNPAKRPMVLELGNDRLQALWNTFCSSVKEFAHPHAITYFSNAMQCSVKLDAGGPLVELRLVLELDSMYDAMLRQRLSPDGGNLACLFPATNKALSKPPPKARWMMAMLKAATHADTEEGSPIWNTVTSLFVEKHWVGDLDQIQEASITFYNVWRECTQRLATSRAASAIELPPDFANEDALYEYLHAGIKLPATGQVEPRISAAHC